jgi:hypothetical protein
MRSLSVNLTSRFHLLDRIADHRELVGVLPEAGEQSRIRRGFDRRRVVERGIDQRAVIAAEQARAALSGQIHGGGRHAVREADRQTSDPVAQVQVRIQNFRHSGGCRHQIGRPARDATDRPGGPAESGAEL